MNEWRTPQSPRTVPLVVAALALLSTPADGQEVAEVPRIEKAECVTEALVEANADCYMFFGQEDRDNPGGTIVELPVAVLVPATGIQNSDPVFFFPGGPGGSPMPYAGRMEEIGDRTLVLIEHRGFVHAKPELSCPGLRLSPFFNQLSPVIVSSTDTMERLRIHAESVEECYAKLVSEGVNVRKYNGYDVARDVDEIRTLLGYDKINIYGSSAGGGGVISYLRYFPDSVRSMVLGWPWYGEYRDRAAIDEYHTIKQKYTDILGICVAEDPRCRRLLPSWYYEIDRARRALDEKPFLKVVETKDGKKRTLSFDGVALMGTIYQRFEDVYAKLPNVLSRIQKGDHSALDDFFMTERWSDASQRWSDGGLASMSYGYYLAHICGGMGTNRPKKEDVFAMLEREPALLGFEDNKICAWWGSDGAVPPEHRDRFKSDVPALSLHGQVDSCCGIRWGHYVARTMPNLQLVELQGLGHGVPGPCRDKLISSFLDDPYAQVDDSCKGDVPLGPWVFE